MTKKTIPTWLEESLTPSQYRRAKRYLNKKAHAIGHPKPQQGELFTSADKALGSAFQWNTTKEGHSYWEDVHEKLGGEFSYD